MSLRWLSMPNHPHLDAELLALVFAGLEERSPKHVAINGDSKWGSPHPTAVSF